MIISSMEELGKCIDSDSVICEVYTETNYDWHWQIAKLGDFSVSALQELISNKFIRIVPETVTLYEYEVRSSSGVLFKWSDLKLTNSTGRTIIDAPIETDT